MNKRFKTLIYGKNHECQAVEELLRAHPEFSDLTHIYCNVNSHEDFHVQLVDWIPHLVVVVEDGAAGMEGVFLANNRRPTTPVLWFSDDHIFAMQSHRLECAYFSTKPVTAEKIQKALQRCQHVGIALRLT